MDKIAYCIVSDDSGHEYLIPAELKEKFYDWVEAPDGNLDEIDFDKYRIGRSLTGLRFDNYWWE